MNQAAGQDNDAKCESAGEQAPSNPRMPKFGMPAQVFKSFWVQMYHRRNVAIQETKLTIAKTQRPHFCRVHVAMILAMVLIAGAMPAMSRAQAGGGGDDDQSSGSAADSVQSGNGQTSCGPGTGIECPQGSNGAGNGTVGGQIPWQNGFTQGQRPNSGMIGPQPVGRVNGPQRTIPAAKPAVPQPAEFMENPDFLSACPAMPIEEEMNPSQEEGNPRAAPDTNQLYPYNQGYPYSAAGATNPNGAPVTEQRYPYSGGSPILAILKMQIRFIAILIRQLTPKTLKGIKGLKALKALKALKGI